jgi:hypothetical protein
MAENVSDFADEEPLSIEGGEEEPLGLVESAQKEGKTQVRAFGGPRAATARKEEQFKRPLNVTGQGATRCKVFHSKIAVPSLEFMENQINEWLDGEKIEIKAVGQVIGTMEGKTPVPNLIVMVWY